MKKISNSMILKLIPELASYADKIKDFVFFKENSRIYMASKEISKINLSKISAKIKSVGLYIGKFESSRFRLNDSRLFSLFK